MEDITYGPATAADLDPVRALLERCELPTADLRAEHLEHFVVCRRGDQLAGTAGVELHGGDGLLRSLAVAPELRGRRLGHGLWARVLDQATRLGIRRLYLLTTTAETLFSSWGFHRIARDAVPSSIQATAEYSALCPSTATVMAMDLAGASVSVS